MREFRLRAVVEMLLIPVVIVGLVLYNVFRTEGE